MRTQLGSQASRFRLHLPIYLINDLGSFTSNDESISETDLWTRIVKALWLFSWWIFRVKATAARNAFYEMCAAWKKQKCACSLTKRAACRIFRIKNNNIDYINICSLDKNKAISLSMRKKYQQEEEPQKKVNKYKSTIIMIKAALVLY